MRSAPAQILTFGEEIEKSVGETVELPCKAVGIPTPIIDWKIISGQTTKAISNSDHLQVLMNGSLRIINITHNEGKNYSCFASNIHGSDSITFAIKVEDDDSSTLFPQAPVIEVVAVSSNSITLKYSSSNNAKLPIRAQELHYKEIQQSEWKKHLLTEGAHNKTFTIGSLMCGTRYQLYAMNINTIGKTRSSDILHVKTLGREPIAASPFTFLSRINASAVKLNLYSWLDGGCPITNVIIRWKLVGSQHWNQTSTMTSASDSVVLASLEPNSKYIIKVVMKNDAGSKTAEYDVNFPSRSDDLYYKSVAPEHAVDSNEEDRRNEDILPLVLITLVSSIIIIGSLFSAALLYKTLQQRLTRPSARNNNSGLLHRVLFGNGSASSSRGREILATNAELSSLTCELNRNKLNVNDSNNTITTSLHESENETKYQYVTIPRRSPGKLPDLYATLHKPKLCNPNNETMVVNLPNQSRYEVYNNLKTECKKFHCNEDELHASMPSESCCSFCQKQCCAIFDGECCSGLEWRETCDYNVTLNQ